jgi:hypothetical protein
LRLEPTKAMQIGATPTKPTNMLMDLQGVHTATIHIIPTPAPRTVSTVRDGLQAECLSAPDLGITGARGDTGAAVGTGVVAATGADTLGVTDGASPAAATDVATPAAVDSMAEAPFAVEAGVDFTVAAASTVAAEAMVADTDNRQLRSKTERLAAVRC